MAQLLDTNDMLFHALIVGGTGSGKTNCILYMLDLLFNKKEEGVVPPSLFLFDPAGDASIDLVRAIPRSEQSRVVILDPPQERHALRRRADQDPQEELDQRQRIRQGRAPPGLVPEVGGTNQENRRHCQRPACPP